MYEQTTTTSYLPEEQIRMWAIDTVRISQIGSGADAAYWIAEAEKLVAFVLAGGNAEDDA